MNFTWHAVAAGPGYDEVEFPGTLNDCTTCHVPNTFDFTNATNFTALASEPLSTAATSTLITDPEQNSTFYTISPYIVSNTNYGVGFSYNAATNATTEAADTNLVHSPITGACSACHDSTIAINHMKANGGQFYAPRGPLAGRSQLAAGEQCLICHGPGRVAAIGEVHQH